MLILTRVCLFYKDTRVSLRISAFLVHLEFGALLGSIYHLFSRCSYFSLPVISVISYFRLYYFLMHQQTYLCLALYCICFRLYSYVVAYGVLFYLFRCIAFYYSVSVIDLFTIYAVICQFLLTIYRFEQFKSDMCGLLSI